MEKFEEFMENFIQMGSSIDNMDDIIKFRKKFEKDIKKYSIEDIYDYLENTRNNDVYIFIMEHDDRLEDDRIVTLSIRKYKEGLVKKDSLLYLINSVIENEINEDNLDELKQIFKGEEEKIYKILPAEEQTTGIMERVILEIKKNDVYFYNNRMIELWENCKEQSVSKLELIINFLESDDNKNPLNSLFDYITPLWTATNNKDDIDLLEVFMHSPKFNLHSILHCTPPENKRVIEELFKAHFKNESQEQIEKKMDKYYQFNSINKDVYRTLDLKILSDGWGSLSLEQIIRISSDKGMCREIIRMNQDIIDSLVKIGDGFFENLQKINENCYMYPNLDLLYNSQLKKQLMENPELFEKYINIMLKDSKNYFSVENIEDIKNYELKKREICFKLLKGERTETKLDKYDNIMGYHILPENKKKFALLELIYGIDYESAENLVNKYGKGLEQIDEKNSEEEVIKHYISSLKRILELEDIVIDKMLEDEEFIRFLENSELPEIASSVLLEEDIVKIFQREFDKEIEKSSKPIKKSRIEYEGNKIEVEDYSPIDKNGNFIYTEFSTFARQEGAYTEWIQPDNYEEYFNIQSAMSHGNCESFINQSQIAMARSSGGPKVGYLDAGKVLLMAPWDISSKGENMKASTISAKWNAMCGICYLPPDEFINCTRHSHNEFVSDRIINVNEENKTMEKRTPGVVLFIKETYNEDIKDEDNLRQSEWEEAKRAARDLKIPIRRIDRQGFAIQEEMVIQHDLELLGGENAELLSGIEDIEQLTGKKCNSIDWSKKLELTREELIKEIIVRFENNAIGMKFASENEKYFTEEKRQCVVNSLMRAIEKGKEANPKQYYKDLETIEQIIKEEREKETTRGEYSKKVYSVSSIYLELENQVNHKLEELGREVYSKVENISELSDIIKFTYNSKIYDENKEHSMDHISKVILFADILAKNECISERDTDLLLIAASLHDCGREGKDGNEPHGVLSAEKSGKILAEETSSLAKFNLTEQEVKIIQMVIEYHETPENMPGQIQIANSPTYDKNWQQIEHKGILDLQEKYGISEEDLLRVEQLCALLKDADALDRERFSSENASLNMAYLHTESAKDIRMTTLANRLNNAVANKILGKYYGKNETSINAVNELYENRENDSFGEKEVLTIDEMIEAMHDVGIDLGLGIDDKNKVDMLRQHYNEERVGTTDVQIAIDGIKKNFQKLQQQSQNLGKQDQDREG